MLVFRYIAITWNIGEAQSDVIAHFVSERVCALGHEWSKAFDQPGLMVYCTGASVGSGNVQSLGDNAGVVLGTLFERRQENASPIRISTFGPGESREIVATGGRNLIEHYWGWYIAFIRDSSKRRTFILRGPVSGLPCLHTTYGRVHIFFSRMDDCIALGVNQFTVDWSYMAAYVAFKLHSSGSTAITDVDPIEAGECVKFDENGTSKSFYWHPCSIAKLPALEDFDEAARILRETLKHCVAAWAACHATILHRLSGGLDSSIVLACLAGAAARPALICMNYHTPGAYGDERRFARAVAERARCELIERQRDETVSLRAITAVSRTSRPRRDYSGFSIHGPEVALARERGATAVFSGEFGDALFEHGMNQPAATEFVWRHGLRPGLADVVRDTMARERLSAWRVLRLAIRDGLLSRHKASWSTYLREYNPQQLSRIETRLASADAVSEAARTIDRFVHPWFRSAQGVPPGKLWMISSLDASMSYDNPFNKSDDPPTMSPLLSQPVVELCLRIATYLSIRNGRDRAVARAAFSQELPVVVLNRTTKGSPEPWIRKALARDRTFARDFLLDGLLLRERLIDRRKLEASLAPTPTKSTVPNTELIRALYTESWLRNWTAGGSGVRVSDPTRATTVPWKG